MKEIRGLPVFMACMFSAFVVRTATKYPESLLDVGVALALSAFIAIPGSIYFYLCYGLTEPKDGEGESVGKTVSAILISLVAFAAVYFLIRGIT